MIDWTILSVQHSPSNALALDRGVVVLRYVRTGMYVLHINSSSRYCNDQIQTNSKQSVDEDFSAVKHSYWYDCFGELGSAAAYAASTTILTVY